MEHPEIKFRFYTEETGVVTWHDFLRSRQDLVKAIRENNPMPFTGIIGRNATDIYDKDIVIYHTGHARVELGPLVTYTGVITWDKNGWALKSYVPNEDKIVYFNLNGNYWFGGFKHSNFEPIGNIYTMPEFVTNKDWVDAESRRNYKRKCIARYFELDAQLSRMNAEVESGRYELIRSEMLKLRGIMTTEEKDIVVPPNEI